MRFGLSVKNQMKRCRSTEGLASRMLDLVIGLLL